MLTTQSPAFDTFADPSFFRIHDPLGIMQYKTETWVHDRPSNNFYPGSTRASTDSNPDNEYSEPTDNNTSNEELEIKEEETLLEAVNEAPNGQPNFNDNELFRKNSAELSETKEDGEDNAVLKLIFEYESGCETLPLSDLSDIEKLLEDICNKNSIFGRVAICFKISILRNIREEYPDNVTISELLDELLTINFNIIMKEMNENY